MQLVELNLSGNLLTELGPQIVKLSKLKVLKVASFSEVFLSFSAIGKPIRKCRPTGSTQRYKHKRSRTCRQIIPPRTTVPANQLQLTNDIHPTITRGNSFKKSEF